MVILDSQPPGYLQVIGRGDHPPWELPLGMEDLLDPSPPLIGLPFLMA